MIESVSDFTLVDVDPFKEFLDEFKSYPERANAAGGMPYDSLSDLDGKLDPPLKCLDPAWLTELVREIEWFRTRGFGIPGDDRPGYVPTATGLAGDKKPPAVVKDFLEEARRTVRRWAEEWELDGYRRNFIVEDGLPTEWTSLGAITMPWSGDDVKFPPGATHILPPGANDYALPDSELDPVTEYRRILAERSVRDFLSIRLFDREMPDDDPSVPEFGWQETDDKLEEGDDRKGVDVKYLSRQILALHSDCEKVATMIVPIQVDPDFPDDCRYRIREEGHIEVNGQYKERDCPGCGTVHTGDGSESSWEVESYDPCLPGLAYGHIPQRIPVTTGIAKASEFPLRHSYKDMYDIISYQIDSCYDRDCELTHYSVSELWSQRNRVDYEKVLDGTPTISFECSVPDFVEVEKVWVSMVVLSRTLDTEYTIRNFFTGEPGHDEQEVRSEGGTYNAQLFFALVPAEFSGGKLTVSSIPDVPKPSGGVQVEPASDVDPDPPENPSESGRRETSSQHHHVTLDAAEIVGFLGVVAKVKFRASVK